MLHFVPIAGSKPLDIGDGRLVASIASSGRALLSVTSYHAEQGVVELSAVPVFDERKRGNPAAVRRYRQTLASDDFPCLSLEGWPTEEPRWADAWAEDGAIVLRWRLALGGTHRLRFSGRLDRPALAEITELDPPRPTGALTELVADGDRLVVRSTLPGALAIESSTGTWLLSGTEAALDVGAAEGDLTVRISSLYDLPRARRRGRSPEAGSIVGRALTYTRNCAALSVAEEEVVLLADHRLLPLSWTRDAYYQALLLLASGDAADLDLVADHLRWLWRRCERPGGRWLRSHHANGRPKDVAFQADQQLYPMLELADYWRTTRILPAHVDWTAEVPRAWSAATAEIDSATGLIATVENAADDPVAAPFVASSQILLWYTALRLAELADAEEVGLAADELLATANAARVAFEQHLAADGRWLYATDTRGLDVDYHDANDLPVALAPLFGFCAADDAAWRRTMEFAFSPSNPGYFVGERGGLGSAHTPMPWTLGDIQAWVFARTIGDRSGMSAANARLTEVAFQDSMLPEAYSATREPDVRVRHWFAWPGAAFAALTLFDARGELEERLMPARSLSP